MFTKLIVDNPIIFWIVAVIAALNVVTLLVNAFAKKRKKNKGDLAVRLVSFLLFFLSILAVVLFILTKLNLTTFKVLVNGSGLEFNFNNNVLVVPFLGGLINFMNALLGIILVSFIGLSALAIFILNIAKNKSRKVASVAEKPTDPVVVSVVEKPTDPVSVESVAEKPTDHVAVESVAGKPTDPVKKEYIEKTEDAELNLFDGGDIEKELKEVITKINRANIKTEASKELFNSLVKLVNQTNDLAVEKSAANKSVNKLDQNISDFKDSEIKVKTVKVNRVRDMSADKVSDDENPFKEKNSKQAIVVEPETVAEPIIKEETSVKNDQPSENNLEAARAYPIARRHVILNRMDAVNAFSDYIAEKKKASEDNSVPVNTIILKK